MCQNRNGYNLPYPFPYSHTKEYCPKDRSNGKSNITNKIVSQIQIQIPTYKKEDLPKHLEKIKAVKPGSRNL